MKGITDERFLSIKEYDDKGNLIHYKRFDGKEKWYDENKNLVRIKYPNGEIKDINIRRK